MRNGDWLEREPTARTQEPPQSCHPERSQCFANAKQRRSRKPALSEAEGDPSQISGGRGFARNSLEDSPLQPPRSVLARTPRQAADNEPVQGVLRLRGVFAFAKPPLRSG